MPGFGSSYKPTASPYGPAGAGVAGSFRPGGGGGGLAGPYRPAGGAMAGGNPDFRASDTASYLLGQAGQSGLFNPTGSPQIRRLMRNRAMRNFENRRRRSGILSQLYGLDPNQSRAAMVGSDIAGHGALSQGLMDADYQESTANRPFLQSLL